LISRRPYQVRISACKSALRGRAIVRINAGCGVAQRGQHGVGAGRELVSLARHNAERVHAHAQLERQRLQQPGVQIRLHRLRRQRHDHVVVQQQAGDHRHVQRLDGFSRLLQAVRQEQRGQAVAQDGAGRRQDPALVHQVFQLEVGAAEQRVAGARDQQMRLVGQRLEIQLVGRLGVEDAAHHQIEFAAAQALDQHLAGRHGHRHVHARVTLLQQVDRLRHQAGGRRQH
ncbi:conserved hypothetical protein, partial [Ricinus communis]